MWLIKPGFVQRQDLLVGEGVDLSLFTDSEEPGRTPNGGPVPATG